MLEWHDPAKLTAIKRYASKPKRGITGEPPMITDHQYDSC